jgi:hypothetical protein
MRCCYCKTPLAPLRSLTDGEFCCDDHRHAYAQERAALGDAFVGEPETAAGLLDLLEAIDPVEMGVPVALEVPVAAAESTQRASIAVREAFAEAAENAPAGYEMPAPDLLLPLDFSSQLFDTAEEVPLEPISDLEFPGALQLPVAASELASIPFELEPELEPEPVLDPQAMFETEAALDANADAQPMMASEPALETEPGLDPAYTVDSSWEEETEFDASLEESGSRLAHPAREVAASWKWLSAAWKTAPRDLKAVTVLLPVLLAVALSPSVPKVKVAIPHVATGDVQQVEKVVAERWKSLNQTISNRAAIAFADDFRTGLDAWESRSNLTSSWSYDQTGFVRPGPLAVFKPSVELSDYHFEFLGAIDQRAMGWAFRAKDLDNYYAMKLVVVKPGPLPLVHLVRYAVVNGKEGPHTDKPLPITVHADMLYRILVDVRGDDFTVMTQGQVVDFWSDSRLRHGGVGFFCNRGERARLRWVEVSHQYDALGKLCAYLAPYGMEGRNGSIN